MKNPLIYLAAGSAACLAAALVPMSQSTANYLMASGVGLLVVGGAMASS